MSFKEYYKKDIVEKLMKEFNIDNPMAVPRVTKIVVNVGAGEAVSNKNIIPNVEKQLALITGQKPIITKARKSISAFKVRKGFPIGVKVTLRDKRMFDFLEKIIKIVIPRIRDFRGISPSNIDQHGNLNLGFSEQTIFPEISYDEVDKIRGLEVTIVTSLKDREKGLKLFEILGFPFKKG